MDSVSGSFSNVNNISNQPMLENKDTYRERIDNRLEYAEAFLETLRDVTKNNINNIQKDMDDALSAVKVFRAHKDSKCLHIALDKLRILDAHDDGDFASGRIGCRRHAEIHKVRENVEVELKKYEALDQFCNSENKELMKDFQEQETHFLLKKHDPDQDKTWITDVHRNIGEHIDGAFDHLEMRVKKPGHEQIPIILGGMELRKYQDVNVEDKEAGGNLKTKGIVESFGSLHQPDKLDSKFDPEAKVESRRRLEGYGGVLETKDYSLTFNIISVLVPSVFTGEPIYYGKEDEGAEGLRPWERSITDEGKIRNLDVVRDIQPNYPNSLGLPNVKAKELMFLLKAGFKPEWVEVGKDKGHRQLAFVPPTPEEFNLNFSEAIASLNRFRNEKVEGGEFERLLRDNKLIG